MAEHDIRFRGKVIVITGAGGQFGKEGCLFFAARGAKVAALDMSAPGLEATAKQVKENTKTTTTGSDDNNDNDNLLTIVCNVTDAISIQKAIDEIVAKFGTIDLLWNNAGYQGEIKPTLEYDPVDFNKVMQINVTGMFIVLQAVAKVMAKNKQGVICNTSSVAGLRGTPAMVAYASSKAAVLSMTISTSKDLAPYNIRVNAVSPALIGPGYMWNRQNELHAASGSPYFDRDPEVVAKNKINGVALKRLGSIEEVIKSVAFLLSDDSSYTTGTNLVVDGGMNSGIKC